MWFRTLSRGDIAFPKIPETFLQIGASIVSYGIGAPDKQDPGWLKTLLLKIWVSCNSGCVPNGIAASLTIIAIG